MRRGRPTHAAIAAGLAAVLGLVVSVGPAHASPVDQQEARVEEIADQLDLLENRLGQLEEDHAAALDRLDELDIEIGESQARVDAQGAALALLRGQLTGVAVDKFTAGGSAGLTPLFSSATSFTDELQRDQLSRLALDQGAGTSDELQALITELADETARLDRKKDEQAQLLASLEVRQQEGEALTVELQSRYSEAQAELGELIVQEQERRAAAAAAEAAAEFARRQQAAAAAARAATPPPPSNRGGGAAAPAPIGSSPAPADPRPAPAPSPTPAPSPEPAVPAPSSRAGVALAAAQSQLGVPYRFAASSPGVAFDCSGLTKYAWGRAGVSLPHQSAQQYAVTPHVPKDQAQPGDLIFYHSPIGHVGIYLGGGSLIHAPATGDVVKISAVNWSKVVGVARPG
jgi:cell wall-associated NlpC family hydrolase/uncharacterized coiled-coil protein SlyX